MNAIPPGSRLKALQATLGGVVIYALALSLWPWLTLYDAGTATDHLARAITLTLLGAIGWFTFGASLKNSRFPRLCAWIFLAVATWGVLEGVALAGEWTYRKLFRGSASAPFILSLFSLNEPLSEKHFAWVPYLTLTMAAVPALCIGAASRLFLSRSSQTSHSRWWIPFAFSLGLLAWPLDTWVTHQPHSFQTWLPQIASGNPFHEFFRYQIVQNKRQEYGQRFVNGQVLRVMERDSSPELGKWHFAAGREILTTDAKDADGLRVSALFSFALADAPKTALIAGFPEPALAQELQRSGITHVDLASGPQDIVNLDWLFNPNWAGIPIRGFFGLQEINQNAYDLVLFAPAAPWRLGENPAQSNRLQKLAESLRPQGIAALVLPASSLPEQEVETLWSHFQSAFAGKGTHRAWMLPRGLQTPRLLFTASPEDLPKQLPKLVSIGLRAAGLPLSYPEDLALLQIPTTKAFGEPSESSLFAWSRLRTRQAKGVQLEVLAAEALAVLPKTPLSTALANHLASQQWTLPDSQFASELKQMDLTQETTQGFLQLARQFPQSLLLQRLWMDLAQALIEKREVEWADDALPILVEELGWRHPVFLWAAGRTALEMMEPEQALQYAEEILRRKPEMLEAQALREDALQAK